MCYTCAYVCYGYDRHIPIIKKIISNTPYDAPTLEITKRDDFYKFDRNDFVLKDYKFHEFMERIPIAE